jgi:hypothetical protein
MHALEAEGIIRDDSALQGLANVIATALAPEVIIPLATIPLAMWGVFFAWRWMRELLMYDTYSPREALSTLPVSKSNAMLERQVRERTATRNGASIVLRVPTGCDCPMCKPDAKQKELIEGMLNPPPLHEYRGWAEYAER